MKGSWDIAELLSVEAGCSVNTLNGKVCWAQNQTDICVPEQGVNGGSKSEQASWFSRFIYNEKLFAQIE